jgi:hypothetical protein
MELPLNRAATGSEWRVVHLGWNYPYRAATGGCPYSLARVSLWNSYISASPRLYISVSLCLYHLDHVSLSNGCNLKDFLSK